jgi:NAD(P)-dependent dehydrogenase (short-subunit alcohol dehydrogenase family)
VIVTGQNPKTIDATRSEVPGIDVMLSNQRDIASSKRLIEQIKQRYDRIDVLFVNAGIAHFAPLESVDEEFFDLQFGINVRGAHFVAKHAVPIIPDGGAIIFTGSTAGSSGGPAMSVYSATKAAIRSLGRTLAAELAPRNIRVNIVSPGPISTPIFGKTGLSKEQIDGFLEGIKTRVPLARIGKPEEVAVTVLFLHPTPHLSQVRRSTLVAGSWTSRKSRDSSNQRALSIPANATVKRSLRPASTGGIVLGSSLRHDEWRWARQAGPAAMRSARSGCRPMVTSRLADQST